MIIPVIIVVHKRKGRRNKKLETNWLPVFILIFKSGILYIDRQLKFSRRKYIIHYKGWSLLDGIYM